MVVESFTLPPLMKEEVEAIPKTGLYASTSEFIRDAIRAYFAVRRDIRVAVAIELYNENKISSGRAAEIADVSYDDMKKILMERKVWKENSIEKTKEATQTIMKRMKLGRRK